MSSTKRLLVVLASGSPVASGPASLAFRYAATAAALDLAVEIHVVGESVKLFQKPAASSAGQTGVSQEGVSRNAGFSAQALQAQIREMREMGVKLFACSAALADAGLSVADLIPEVDGVRGAAALLAAGMADDTRLMSF